MKQNVQGLSGLINLDGDRTIYILDKNNAFANQNLNSITSSLKDLSRIENSISRLIDNHHNLTMMEKLNLYLIVN